MNFSLTIQRMISGSALNLEFSEMTPYLRTEIESALRNIGTFLRRPFWATPNILTAYCPVAYADVLSFLAKALLEHPEMTGHVAGDDDNTRILFPTNIGADQVAAQMGDFLSTGLTSFRR